MRHFLVPQQPDDRHPFVDTPEVSPDQVAEPGQPADGMTALATFLEQNPSGGSVSR